MTINLFILVLALVFLLIAALKVPEPAPHGPSWGWLGMFLWLLSVILKS